LRPTAAARCTEWNPSRHSVGGDRPPAWQASLMLLMRAAYPAASSCCKTTNRDNRVQYVLMSIAGCPHAGRHSQQREWVYTCVSSLHQIPTGTGHHVQQLLLEIWQSDMEVLIKVTVRCLACAPHAWLARSMRCDCTTVRCTLLAVALLCAPCSHCCCCCCCCCF
jgi:hypothetical protein